jgi:hypothetical protein
VAIEDAAPCIVASYEDGTIDVDTEHPAYPKPRMGLGDMVAAVTKAVGIKPCGGCLERQKALNEWGKIIGIGTG